MGGADISGFSGSDDVYIVTLDPTGAPTITLEVAQAAASALDGDPTAASGVLRIVSPSADPGPTPTDEAVSEVMAEEVLEQQVLRLRNHRSMLKRARSAFQEANGARDACRNREDLYVLSENNPCDWNALRSEPMVYDGTFMVMDDAARLNGTVLKQTGSVDGRERRLIFAQIEASQRDGNDVTLNFDARVSWERLADDRLSGRFVGLEYQMSDVIGDLSGERDSLSIFGGVYGLRQVSKSQFLDGYVTLGFGRNDLSISDYLLTIDGSYDTINLETGLSWSGLREGSRYQLRPDLELNYAGAWIMGDALIVDELASNQVSLTVDYVSTFEVRFDPELRIPLSDSDFDPYRTSFIIEPAVFCVQTNGYETVSGCGIGVEVALQGRSDDDLSRFGISAGIEEVSSSDRAWVSIEFERSF